VINANTSQLGGAFTLCVRRFTGSGTFISAFSPAVFTSGCQKVYAVSANGASSYSISFVAQGQAGAPVLVANAQTPALSQFVGPNGERVQYNTTYNATITVNYQFTLGDGSTETISVSNPAGLIVVGSHIDLDLASLWTCPGLVNMGGTIRATTWMCDAVKYQWRFERMLNGQLFLQNGNPVVIEGYGVTGTRDYVVTAANGFGAGTEWRVQIRPVFANNVVGQYYTLYQCMKLKGTAAAAPLAAADEVAKEFTASESQDYQIYPNPIRSGHLTVSNSAYWEGDVVIRIYDIKGQKVYEVYQENVMSSMMELNFDKPSSGMYWLEIQSSDKTQRQRLIVE
jgi:hypothetical protein